MRGQIVVPFGMLTLSELAIHKARLLRGEHDQSRVAELDRMIIVQHALNLDDAIIKLELAREMAHKLDRSLDSDYTEIEEVAEIVTLIDDVLRVLRH